MVIISGIQRTINIFHAIAKPNEWGGGRGTPNNIDLLHRKANRKFELAGVTAWIEWVVW
jgi:hypothetical protein